mmetsp:Transcript_63452/g.206104  ORF Transcript_63452/g.206104 Transcript_63452/m.206104 type:complete len:484 (+) Transcript_63452:279-1730(+)
MSWALMLHPEGLECDLFVSHCWDEGIYEFIDKVLLSWPRSARHVYCCMLSNPQNLDIGSLLSTPRFSPFARALMRADYVLVVPNERCSIYTRIWCIYEAFLAYESNKLIYTAMTPISRFWPRILWIVILWALGVCLSGVAIVVLPKSSCAMVDTSFVVGALVPCGVAVLSRDFNKVLIANRVGAITNGFLGGFLGSVFCGKAIMPGLDHASVTLFWCLIWSPMTFAASEADVLWGEAARLESARLRCGYTGDLQDACASDPRDKARILQDIDSLGLKLEVENAVEVLMRASMSTPRLRSLTMHGVDVYGAGVWNLTPLMFVGGHFLVEPLAHILLKDFCHGVWWWAPFLGLSMGCSGLVLFVLQGPDQKGFAASVAAKFICFPDLASLIVSAFGGFDMLSPAAFRCGREIMGAIFLGPLMLTTMLIGLEGFAAIPTFGPAIVRCVLPSEEGTCLEILRCLCCRAFWGDAGDDNNSEESTSCGD